MSQQGGSPVIGAGVGQPSNATPVANTSTTQNATAASNNTEGVALFWLPIYDTDQFTLSNVL